ncbi:MAG: PAS domain S-box protein [Acidobacteria bacterium]|nr:PAS domain S-box protein [Acidobacteriota bacterium]
MTINEKGRRALGNAESVRARSLFERIAGTSPDILFVFDVTESRNVYVNARVEAVLGYTVEQFEAAPVEGNSGIAHPDDLPAIARWLAGFEGAGDNDVRELEYRVRHADGSYRWLRVRASVFEGFADGHVRQLVGTAQDVTDLKRDADALAASEQRFRAAIEAVSSLLWTNNAQGRMEGEQPGWAAFTGQPYEEYQGYGWSTAVHPDDAQPTIDAWNQAVREKRTFDFEHRVRRRDGEWRSFSIRAVPVVTADGTISEWVGVHTDITEGQQAEHRLRESEGRLRLFVEHAPAALAMFDREMRYLAASRRWQSDYGLASANVPGLSHDDDVRDMPERWKSVHLRALSGEVVREDEHRFDRADGSTLWLKWEVRPWQDAAGDVGGVVVFTEDITARKRAEEETGLHRRLVENVLDCLPAAVAMLRGEPLRFELVNPAYQSLAPGRQMLGRTTAEVWPETHPEFEQRCHRVLDSGEPFHLVDEIFMLQALDGPLERRQFSWSIHRVSFPGDDAPGALVTVWETTERFRAAQALIQSEERFRQLANTIPQLAWMADPDGWITWYNQRWHDYCGTTPEEMEGWGWQRVHDPEALPAVMERWKSSIESGKPFDMTFPLRGADGVFRPFLTRVNPLLDGEGRVILWFGTNTDISDQKRNETEKEQLLESERRARADAEHASRLKDEFLATLSHELRTPLNAILGWSQLLRHHHSQALDIGEGLTVIERNARMQAQLVEDLLDMSRIVSGKLRIDVQRVDVAGVIDEAIEAVRPAAEAKGLRIEKVLDTHVGAVRGDPARLQQVVWNLLMNAIKFTPRSGKVQVALERVNSHIEITVADNGEGITPEFLPHVFERFRQADAASTRKHSGLGLGLAIVKSIVEAHGGQVRVKSPGAGRGSTFSVELPLVIAQTSAEDRLRQHPRTTASDTNHPVCEERMLQGVSVLVVDDERDARELIRFLLEECHAEVMLAENAAEALEILRRSRPDVLLSDIGMPNQDGYALIRNVRELAASDGGDTPAAALTAFARSEDRRRALLAGYQSHVAKPVEPAELVTVVASLAGKLRKVKE